MYIEQCVSLVFLFWGEVGNFRSSQVVPRECARSPNSESRRVKLSARDGRYACQVSRAQRTRVTLRVGDHLGSV